MPVNGLAQFEREARAAGAEAVELVRRGFGDVVGFGLQAAIDNSPTADPDAPGSGRLRASWTGSRNAPDLKFAALTGGAIPKPTEAYVKSVADSVQLGDEVVIANGSPCISTVNDRTAFVDGVVAATQSKYEEVARDLSVREVSGRNAIARATP